MGSKIKSIEDIQGLSYSFMASQTFLSGIELDIFTCIGREKLQSSIVSKRTGSSLRGTEALLNALAGMGLIIKDRQGRFRNAPLSLKHLVRGGKDFIADGFRHAYSQYKDWGMLAESVRSGKPLQGSRDSRRFFLAMHYNGIQKAKILSERINTGTPVKMLDLGSGPGTYTIQLLEKHKTLQSVLVDFEDAHKWARRFGKEAGVLGRMKFINGDFLKADPGTDYDIALLSNIIHIYSEKENLRLIKKIKGCLKQSGLIIIHDIFLDESKTTPLRASLFSLNMLLHTNGGRSYSRGEAADWLAKTGFQKSTYLPFMNNTGAVTALNGR